MQIKFKRFKLRVNKCAVVSKWEGLTHSLINNTQILVRHKVSASNYTNYTVQVVESVL